MAVMDATPADILRAIESGGGQSCDVRGVILALNKAGFGVSRPAEWNPFGAWIDLLKVAERDDYFDFPPFNPA